MNIKNIKELSNPITNCFNLIEKHNNCKNNTTGNLFYDCKYKNTCTINKKIRILSDFIVEDKLHDRLCAEIKKTMTDE